MRRKWEDLAYRDEVIASRTAAEQRPDFREKQRAAANTRWDDPQQKEQQRKTGFALWQDQNYRLTVLTARLLRRAGHIEDTYGPGVRPESVSFLTSASSNGTWKALEESDHKAANLIRLYFRTEATLDELAAALHIKPHIVRGIILKGIEFLWQKLSPDLQEQFPLKTILRLKITQTPKTKEKMRKSANARLAQKTLDRNEEESDQFEPEREIWSFLKKHSLLDKLEADCIPNPISPLQFAILANFFENGGKKPKGLLLEQYSVAAAWIGALASEVFTE